MGTVKDENGAFVLGDQFPALVWHGVQHSRCDSITQAGSHPTDIIDLYLYVECASSVNEPRIQTERLVKLDANHIVAGNAISNRGSE